MKTMKMLWLIVFATIAFKVFGIVTNPTNYSGDQIESLVGMILIIALLSVGILAGWLIGLTRRKITGTVDLGKSVDFKSKLSGALD